MPASPAPAAQILRSRWRNGVAGLYPGYFALVMATGIIANAMYFKGEHRLSDGLTALNVAAYAVLMAMTLARLICFPRAVWRDLTEPKLVFAFFTLVAATDVLGVGLALRGFAMVALVMWLGALALWLALTYLGFATLIVFNTESRADIIFGGWLIAIVATEAVAIHGVVVAPSFAALGLGMLAPLVVVFSHMLWGVGVVLYAIFIVLFAQRIFFSEVRPHDLTPLLWVVMGAAAISTNAGALLIVTDDPLLPFLSAMRPFVDGVTLVMWAWATWWIPLLVAFGIWTHGVHRLPLAYTPLFWSLVFPLGMYALASLRLSQATGVAPLSALAAVMVWVALAAWLATSAGFLAAHWRQWRRRATPAW